VRFAGCAKGAGMIEPNMATMLAYITTDLGIKKETSTKLLKTSANLSFNKISIDGDCSTNDSFFLLPNGASGLSFEALSAVDQKKIVSILETMSSFLSKQVVRDGEGATKFVKVQVTGAANEKDATTVARRVANSLLVKTALFGNDPNYGRVLMALGNSGVPFDAAKVALSLGKIKIYRDFTVNVSAIPKAAEYLRKNTDIDIMLNIGSGSGAAEFYTCDISYDYVKINAEYTT
jgi:glutamate N-acetyltransferase / amino-acid N-acetyltransferase